MGQVCCRLFVGNLLDELPLAVFLECSNLFIAGLLAVSVAIRAIFVRWTFLLVVLLALLTELDEAIFEIGAEVFLILLFLVVCLYQILD